jgi:hypothetical protein
MPLLVPEHDFSRREPQQFGMISFTELDPKQARDHASTYGPFGVVVSDSWARAKGAERVIYVDDVGPAFDAWRSLFRAGYRDLTSRIKHPDDAGWLMAFENKAVAGAVAGSVLWAALLQIYEYMQSAEDSAEREWRIVNPLPNYSVSDYSRKEAIRQASPPEGWAQHLNVVRVARGDVGALLCPRTERDRLVGALPAEYNNAPVIEIEG